MSNIFRNLFLYIWGSSIVSFYLKFKRVRLANDSYHKIQIFSQRKVLKNLNLANKLPMKCYAMKPVGHFRLVSDYCHSTHGKVNKYYWIDMTAVGDWHVLMLILMCWFFGLISCAYSEKENRPGMAKHNGNNNRKVIHWIL